MEGVFNYGYDNAAEEGVLGADRNNGQDRDSAMGGRIVDFGDFQKTAGQYRARAIDAEYRTVTEGQEMTEVHHRRHRRMDNKELGRMKRKVARSFIGLGLGFIIAFIGYIICGVLAVLAALLYILDGILMLAVLLERGLRICIKAVGRGLTSVARGCGEVLGTGLDAWKGQWRIRNRILREWNRRDGE